MLVKFLLQWTFPSTLTGISPNPDPHCSVRTEQDDTTPGSCEKNKVNWYIYFLTWSENQSESYNLQRFTLILGGLMSVSKDFNEVVYFRAFCD